MLIPLRARTLMQDLRLRPGTAQRRPAPATPDTLPSSDPESERLLVVIDTPRGSRVKYKFDPHLKVLVVSRLLPEGLVFPHNFGSVPGTCAEDGDALDALVVGMPSAFPGCVVSARLLGVLRAQQVEDGNKIRNDRLITCLETDVTPARYRNLREFGATGLREIENFFAAYNRAQGRTFKLLGRGSAREAHRVVRAAQHRHDQGRK